MQTLNWLETHIGTLHDAVKTLNHDFCWFLDISEGTNGMWFVRSGESVIFSADTREAVDAFLYGMGLSIMGLTDEAFHQLSATMKKFCDDVTGRTEESE